MRYYPYYGLSGYEEAADTAYTWCSPSPQPRGRRGSGA